MDRKRFFGMLAASLALPQPTRYRGEKWKSVRVGSISEVHDDVVDMWIEMGASGLEWSTPGPHYVRYYDGPRTITMKVDTIERRGCHVAWRWCHHIESPL